MYQISNYRSETATLFVCPMEELYHVIHRAHLSCGHGGIRKTMAKLQESYCNVTREIVGKWIEGCQTCDKSRNQVSFLSAERLGFLIMLMLLQKQKSIITKPILSKDVNCRGQVDLVNMMTSADGDFKYILHYQVRLDYYINHLHKMTIHRKTSADFRSCEHLQVNARPKLHII